MSGVRSEVADVTIVGLGLIGGSLGKALVRQGREVAYIDPLFDEQQAREQRAATRRIHSLEQSAPGSLVVIATPVDVALREIDRFPDLPCSVTSVCSLMEPLQARAASRGLRFVAGHPMAGSHRQGLEAADEHLFEGKSWFLAEGVDGTEAARMAAAVGATVLLVDPDEHDRSVALTSHLPQLLSTALAALIERSGVDVERFSGTGLQTFLRLAASDRSVWEPVFEANPHLPGAFEEFAKLAGLLCRGEESDAYAEARRTAERLGLE